MDHFAKLAHYKEEGIISAHLFEVIRNFFLSYGEAVQENGYRLQDIEGILKKYLELIVAQLQRPHPFASYHKKVVHPFDYYQFGLDFLRPLVVFPKSKVLGIERIDEMTDALARKENVILLANHQTEPDPQAINLLLEKTHPDFAKNMIFVAGHRVITDPLAAPMSKGCDLLCIFSKRHLENPPEKKQEKLQHNQRAMKQLSELLSEGGKCIYVAPSGGRDRLNSEGHIQVAAFDPQSVEMFWLVAAQSGRLAHFYPLALATYYLLPPPSSVEKQIGERRHAHCTPIGMAFGNKIDWKQLPGGELKDKKLKRQLRADFIWRQVLDEYERMKLS